MLAAADAYMRICILIGLKCGLRDQELMHLEFRDISWTDNTLRVQSKDQWGFNPKTWEQREIPVPDDLLAELGDWQKASGVRHTDGHSLRAARARVTFSKMSVALAVQMKGLGF